MFLLFTSLSSGPLGPALSLRSSVCVSQRGNPAATAPLEAMALNLWVGFILVWTRSGTQPLQGLGRLMEWKPLLLPLCPGRKSRAPATAPERPAHESSPGLWAGGQGELTSPYFDVKGHGSHGGVNVSSKFMPTCNLRR